MSNYHKGMKINERISIASTNTNSITHEFIENVLLEFYIFSYTSTCQKINITTCLYVKKIESMANMFLS